MVRRILIGLALLAACARQRPLTTTAAKTAPMFWCAAYGECFTDEVQCRTRGDCSRSTQAWCSQGAMGGDRFVCGTTQERCEELAIASRELFNNRCMLQPEGR